MKFSIIIPTCNAESFIGRCLDSIIAQNANDVEVIICDDFSTDNTEAIINGYRDRLNIQFFTRPGEYLEHCPGNTRREGQKQATGEWITFVDHDDELVPGALDSVRDLLSDENCPDNGCFIAGSFVHVRADGTEEAAEEGITWLHGRFYKREFLEKYGIEFKPDLIANEDLYFNSKVQTALVGNGLPMIALDKVLYRWHTRDGSFSRQPSGDGDRGYIERYFGEYVFAVTEGWFEGLSLYPQLRNYFFERLYTSLLYCYFYYQAFLFWHGGDQVPENISYIAEFFMKFCAIFEISPRGIMKWIYARPELYSEVRRSSIASSTGEFIEANSFVDFVKALAVM